MASTQLLVVPPKHSTFSSSVQTRAPGDCLHVSASAVHRVFSVYLSPAFSSIQASNNALKTNASCRLFSIDGLPLASLQSQNSGQGVQIHISDTAMQAKAAALAP